MTLSFGQQLFKNHGLRQGSYIKSSCISDETRLEWSKSFPKLENREKAKKIKSDSLLVVISQDCDIACRQDSLDSCVEMVVCKNLKSTPPHKANQFVKSVRKLHLQADGQWYEANVDYILTVSKEELLGIIVNNGVTDISLLTLGFLDTIPIWRANRYYRKALPDLFNEKATPVFEQYLPSIEEIARTPEGQEYPSYLRALYIWIDSLEEKDSYEFELFALLRKNTDNATLSKIADIIEKMAGQMEASTQFEDKTDIYADRDSNTFVYYLTRFIKINFDSRSLSAGDIGPRDL